MGEHPAQIGEKGAGATPPDNYPQFRGRMAHIRNRPDIDGLRDHRASSRRLPCWFPPGSGGFIGVDIFFVISGYLIGRGIIEDLADNRFSPDFFERRLLRIVPALAFMLVVVSGRRGPILYCRASSDHRRHAHCEAAGRDIVEHHGIGTDPRPIADPYPPEQHGTRADIDPAPHLGGAIEIVKSADAEGTVLADNAIVADLGRTVDDDSGLMLEDHAPA